MSPKLYDYCLATQLNQSIIGPVPLLLFPSKAPKDFCVAFHGSPLLAQRKWELRSSFRCLRKFKDHPSVKERELETRISGDDASNGHGGGDDLGWLAAFPHVLTASMANFLFGYHIGVMNGPIIFIARELGFEGKPLLEGLVVSIFIAGAFIGSIISGVMIDKLGCRRALQIDTVPLTLGALLSAQAHTVDQMLLGRFLVGLGIGVNTVLVPIYISEVSPTKHRGSLGTLCQIGTCLGLIASLLLGIPSDNDPHWWRMLLYIACLPGFTLIVGMQFAVESPRWLFKVGRVNDAKTIVSKLWGESQVDIAIEEFKSVLKVDGTNEEANWSELLIEPHSKGALFSLYLMDREGRQKLLVGSYLGMAVSMFLLVYAIEGPINDQLTHNLSVLGTLIYVFTFSIGAGPVTGLIIPELSSTRTRAKTMAFSFVVHWVCNFIVGLLFLDLVEKFGIGSIYASFGAVSLLSAMFAKYFIIETKGRSLEEIELFLNPNSLPKDH
ncbi:hypothetical protein AMTRI_Chr10g228070 [Amborella trichopoda]